MPGPAAPVAVGPPTDADLASYADAVRRSAPRLSRFAVPDPDGLGAAMQRQGAAYRIFLIRALDPGPAEGIVGRVNVSTIVRGAYQGATIGYESYDPYAGRGLFTEGLRLVVDACFAPLPGGLGLHRLEANVQPVNIRSAAVLRRLGFVHEGWSPDYLWINGGRDGARAWQDHDRYAAVATDWPAPPYRLRGHPPMAVVLRAGPAAPEGAAVRLAAELAVPVLDTRLVGETAWTLLAGSAVGAVVVVADAHVSVEVRGRLRAAGFDPGRVILVEASGLLDDASVTRTALQVRAAYG